MSTSRTSLWPALLLATACGSRDPGPLASDQVPLDLPAPRPAPTLRLPDGAAPLRYRASLEIDPSATSFRGHIEIDVSLAAASRELWLNAQDLTIEKAVARSGGREETLRPAMSPRNFVALAGAIPAGESTVVIDYRGVQHVALSHGMGRYTDAGHWYVVTQFEPNDARRVFPCFDEPAFKTPWQLELTVPAGMTGFSNTAVEEEEILPGGRRRFRFRPTRPLPSYLIALAVGPFETVDAGKTRAGEPTRIVVPAGRAADAASAAAEVGKILEYLEDYTGISYPYGKLDHLAVPGTQRGAMEHPGLVTYGPRLLLIRPGEAVSARRAQVGVVAHELAHQWFGDLVTTAWWDDLWLNEAFASWMTPKVVEALHPEMDAAIDRVSSRGVALAADSLSSARKIRQPITADADIVSAFDRITYSKGAAVIGMFERWVGPDVFQKATRAYLATHADRNATAADFLAELDRAAEKPVGAAFATFLDQAGVPAIAMELHCPAGGPATLGLSQRRYAPIGAATGSGEPRWQVPVCVAVPDGKARKTQCTLLGEATGQLALGEICPAWVIPNVDGAGYYLARLPDETLSALLERGWSHLSRVERLAVLGDLDILVEGGQADLRVLLALLARLGSSDDPYLVDVAMNRLDKLARIASDEQSEPFARLVRSTLRPAGRRIGWLPKEDEKVADARMRGKLMSLLAIEGQEAAARSRADALARAWLADHRKVPESLWVPILETAVRGDPDAVVPRLLARLREEPDRVAQRTIYQAVAVTPDPGQYRRVLELALAVDPIPPEMVHLFTSFPVEVARQAALFDFERDHADELLRRLPEQFQRSLVNAVCDAARRNEVAGFLTEKLAPLPEVGTLAVTQKIEWMDQCIARRAAQAPTLASFLAGKK